MILTLTIGYSASMALGIGGYAMLGGSGWAWGLFVWIGGAFACLAIAALRMRHREEHHTDPDLSKVSHINS